LYGEVKGEVKGDGFVDVAVGDAKEAGRGGTEGGVVVEFVAVAVGFAGVGVDVAVAVRGCEVLAA
jgi:hypothetical protein